MAFLPLDAARRGCDAARACTPRSSSSTASTSSTCSARSRAWPTRVDTHARDARGRARGDVRRAASWSAPRAALSERPDVLIVPGGGWFDRTPQGVRAEASAATVPAAIAARHAAGADRRVGLHRRARCSPRRASSTAAARRRTRRRSTTCAPAARSTWSRRAWSTTATSSPPARRRAASTSRSGCSSASAAPARRGRRARAAVQLRPARPPAGRRARVGTGPPGRRRAPGGPSSCTGTSCAGSRSSRCRARR